jgi:hypothetical protein
MTAEDEGVRSLFQRDAMLESDWYRSRLLAKQSVDSALWTRHVAALTGVREFADRLEEAQRQLARVSASCYLEELEGTIGADPALNDPWLTVPLRDYETHMSSEKVAQLGALSDIFADALDACLPLSVAILGIAGGNGLDRIDPVVTSRICGIDINPEYLTAVRKRFGGMAGLELHCIDLAARPVSLTPVRMVHAALIFEHAGTEMCLDNAINLVMPGSILSVVLQLPSETEPAVGSSSVASVDAHRECFQFVDREELGRRIEERGFRLVQSTRRPVASGKAFWWGLFERAT